jgi:hypothetical protein
MEALEREVRPGIAEYELAAIVEGAYLPLDGHTHIPYMGTTPMQNPSLCVPPQIQSDRVLQVGDVLITEISAQYDGYPGQIRRPFSIGEPPTETYRRMYDLAVRAFERVAAVIRHSATVEEVVTRPYGYSQGLLVLANEAELLAGCPPELRGVHCWMASIRRSTEARDRECFTRWRLAQRNAPNIQLCKVQRPEGHQTRAHHTCERSKHSTVSKTNAI